LRVHSELSQGTEIIVEWPDPDRSERADS